MKILYYSHNLGLNGAETVISNQLLELKRNNVEVVLVVRELSKSCYWIKQKEEANGIRILSLFNPLPSNILLKYLSLFMQFLGYKRKWKTILEEEKPDLIHIHTTSNLIYDIDFPVNKMVYTFHSEVDRALENSRRSNFYYLKQMAKKGMVFFALNGRMKDRINVLFKTDKIVVVPNAIYIDSIRNSAYARKDFLKTIGVANDAFVLGHVGRFHEVKNHERVVSIFNELHKINNNSYLILAGGDFNGRLNVIRKLVSSYGLDDYVVFLGIREDATKIMNCFDAMVLPSHSESFSLALIEAQSLGVRCVASDAVPEEVICNNNCFRIPLSKSDKYWANLVLSKTLRNKSSDIRQFDIKSVTQQMIKEYKKIIYSD